MLLGMKISCNTNTWQITLSQTHYIDSLLKKFNLEDANPVSPPLDPNVNLNGDELLEDDMRASNFYVMMIGSLIYAALGTHPDIAYVTHRLTQFTHHPAD